MLLRTGWGSRAQDEAAFLNVGESGPVTPGPDVEASRWLAHERPISGFGVETVGIDAGAAGGFDPPFPLHNFLLGAGRLGLTQLANLERLPITGALIVVSPSEASRRHRQPEPRVRVRAEGLVGEAAKTRHAFRRAANTHGRVAASPLRRRPP